MTSTTLARREKFDIGRVFNNTFAVIGRNIALCIGLAAVFSGLPNLVSQLARPAAPAVGDPASLAVATANYTFGYFVGFAVFGILYVGLSLLLQSSLVRAAIEDLNGKRPSFGDCIRVAIRNLLPTLGIGLLVGLGVGVASIALVVPGIILWLGWSVSIPVLIQERLGVFGSMSRSRALTKGSRWALFGLFLILMIIALVIQSMSAVVIYLFHGIAAAVLAALVQTIVSMVISVATAVSYVELRQVKEGISVDELAEIFS
ncbi:hypothetical protein X740_30920 [Mesorhizobium sp. LNHC221B00]|uniref:hypothetical protein n=1 Tax=Mesorhizobium sp. LNHC221B00 TaxID=1287233 RepID=UPI0003CDF8FE|nr:hypothetical protein [Mesorhizobium sp. LNHC221B00]ESY75515.1 hypothetical protein X740_30920 [Mesorhizobium sp. LNHC221B00]